MSGRLTAQPIGFPLLPTPNALGQLSWPSLEDSVRAAIEVILRTRPGEQLRRPEFGAGIANFLHAPNTLDTRQRLRERISESLARWEPRIVVDAVDVHTVDHDPLAVRVELRYRIRRTGAPQHVGLTLTLEGAP